LDSAMSQHINGTLLQANIITGHKDSALLIPKGCLSPDGKVLLTRGKKTDTVMVVTGIISTDWIEVTSGLSSGDQLLKAF
jgi:hypothetical protein